MPEYVYNAIDAQGREVNGQVTAASVSEGVVILESQGLSVQSISSASFQSDAGKASNARTPGKPFRPPESSLDGLFEAIIERRDTLLPALGALVSELPAGRTKRDVEKLIRQVAEASSGAELGKNETVVRWLPLLASGFAADSSSQRVSDLMAYANRDLLVRSERYRLLAYPIFVTLAALLVLGLLSVFLMPIFEDMFNDFGLRLPAPTVALVEVFRLLRGESPRALILIGIAALTLYAALRLWTHFALTTRLFGSFVNGNSASVSAMSILTGRLAELLQIGVPLPDAIWVAGQGCEHYHFKKAAEELASDVYSQITPLSQSRAASRFPANVIHALDALDGYPRISLLRELSTMYAQRVHCRVDWSTGAMAQVSVLLVGLVIAFIVIALLTPLISLVTNLR